MTVDFGNAWRNTPSPVSYYPVFFGDQSRLVLSILEAAGDGDFEPVLAAITGLTDLAEDLTKFLGSDLHYPVDAGRDVLRGYCAALTGLQTWIKDRDAIVHILDELGSAEVHSTASPSASVLAEIDESFCVAIECFNQAWADDTDRPKLAPDTTSTPREEPDALWRMIVRLPGAGTTAGFWILWDLVNRLAARMDDARPSRPVRSATTPVLLAHPWRGIAYVLWLTVDLLEDAPGGLDPDPLALGLTAVRNGKPESASAEQPPAPDFLDLTRTIWKISGVGNRFRGRWRITARHPDSVAGDDRRDFLASAVPRFTGRSVEASLLTAIWAASGQIPYGDPYPPADKVGSPLVLASDVAITACIEPPASGASPIESLLSKVGKIAAKLQAAGDDGLKQRLDTVLLAGSEEPFRDQNGTLTTSDTAAVGANEEEVSDIERQWREAERQCRQGNAQYQGVHIQRVQTIGDAIHYLLETSRFKKAWNDERETEWLNRWQPGTADFAAMARG